MGEKGVQPDSGLGLFCTLATDQKARPQVQGKQQLKLARRLMSAALLTTNALSGFASQAGHPEVDQCMYYYIS